MINLKFRWMPNRSQKKKKDNQSIFYIDSGDLAALWVFPSIPDHTQLNDMIKL